jgi:hypothetical protein
MTRQPGTTAVNLELTVIKLFGLMERIQIDTHCDPLDALIMARDRRPDLYRSLNTYSSSEVDDAIDSWEREKAVRQAAQVQRMAA